MEDLIASPSKSIIWLLERSIHLLSKMLLLQMFRSDTGGRTDGCA